MSELRRYLETQRLLLRGYRLIESLSAGVFLAVVIYLTGRLLGLLFMALKGVHAISPWTPAVFALLSAVTFGRSLFRGWQRVRTTSLRDAGMVVESQSEAIRCHPTRHSEIFVAASFLEAKSQNEFETAHCQYTSRFLPELKRFILPARSLWINLIFAGAALTTLIPLSSSREILVPTKLTAWSPNDYQVLAPYPGAEWHTSRGAISGVYGSKIRFQSMPSSIFQIFVFLKSPTGGWQAIACHDFCEFQLNQSGQYAVGTLFSRSSLFPLQVFTDEVPKSGLFAEVDGELAPALALEVLSQTQLPLEIIASDDLRLTRVELLHRFEGQENILAAFPTGGKAFKERFVLQMSDWKSGEHEILVRPFDDFQSGLSSPLKILFNDEKSIREKRVRELTGLIDEWVHVLADLVETKMDRRLKEGIPERLSEIQYPDVIDSPANPQESMMNVFIKELQSLALRIDRWARGPAHLGQVDDLIKRTESQILYGLSLLFQEKAGSIEETSQNLSDSQADLAKMLEQMKEGKLDINSKALDEAFKKLAQQLEELQKKIAELPQGPGDDFINREALQQQADESQNLADRIEEIRRQAAEGDESGALKELESLLNQLSILSKEMERGLDQWKQNIDKGSLQQAQAFMKKVESLKEREKKLNEKTQALKKKSEEFDQKNKSIFSPQDAKQLKDIQDQIQKSEKEQGEIAREFSEATEAYEQGLEGSEWKEFLLDEESKALEGSVLERMSDSEQGLKEHRLYDADANQQEAITLMDKMAENQKQKMQQMQQMTQKQPQAMKGQGGKVEILGNDAKGEKERRRRIMDSLKQKVGDKFQQSHERYFEELLQR